MLCCNLNQLNSPSGHDDNDAVDIYMTAILLSNPKCCSVICIHSSLWLYLWQITALQHSELNMAHSELNMGHSELNMANINYNKRQVSSHQSFWSEKICSGFKKFLSCRLLTVMFALVCLLLSCSIQQIQKLKLSDAQNILEALRPITINLLHYNDLL